MMCFDPEWLRTAGILIFGTTVLVCCFTGLIRMWRDR